MANDQRSLQTELETYRDKILELLPQGIGKFVLIKGKDVHGVYDTYADAVKVGYEVFGLEPFLVKQVAPSEKVHFFSREIDAACPA